MTSIRNTKVLYINLNRRADRRERLERGIPKDQFDIVRIVATDAQDLPDAVASPLVSKAEDACWRSHQSVYSHIVENGLKYALVLEDDVDFAARKFDQQLLWSLVEFMKHRDIKVLQLGFLHKQYSLRKLGPLMESARDLFRRKYVMSGASWWNSPMVVLDSFRSGAHAYIVNIEGARVLKELNQPTAFPADNFLGLVANSSNPKIRIARINKSLIDQWSRRTLSPEDLDSDIAPKVRFVP